MTSIKIINALNEYCLEQDKSHLGLPCMDEVAMMEMEDIVESILKNKWVDASIALPTNEGYYKVKFSDNSEDEKPFRIRHNKNIHGFMTEKNVTHWKTLNIEQ